MNSKLAVKFAKKYGYRLFDWGSNDVITECQPSDILTASSLSTVYVGAEATATQLLFHTNYCVSVKKATHAVELYDMTKGSTQEASSERESLYLKPLHDFWREEHRTLFNMLKAVKKSFVVYIRIVLANVEYLSLDNLDAAKYGENLSLPNGSSIHTYDIDYDDIFLMADEEVFNELKSAYINVLIGDKEYTMCNFPDYICSDHY